MRWLHFLMNMDLEPQVSEKFRAWIFRAASQYDKEKQLGWSYSTCTAVRRLLSMQADASTAALSARETRLATAILAHYSPSCARVRDGAHCQCELG